MDNNERIAVALERIANHLDFFAEFVKKEMDEEEEVEEPVRPDSVTMNFKFYKPILDDCAYQINMYGNVTVGHLLLYFDKKYLVYSENFKRGWTDINDMNFTLKGDDVILDLTNAKEL